jgi:hypothetical protein
VIQLKNDEDWIENVPTLNEGVDFLSVLVHELGHSLGLAHSPVYSSIMFPYYKGTTPPQLDYDDILAMYQLYSKFFSVQLYKIFTLHFMFQVSRTLEDNADDEEEESTVEVLIKATTAMSNPIEEEISVVDVTESGKVDIEIEIENVIDLPQLLGFCFC